MDNSALETDRCSWVGLCCTFVPYIVHNVDSRLSIYQWLAQDLNVASCATVPYTENDVALWV